MYTNFVLLLPITVIIVWFTVFSVNKRHTEMHNRLFLTFYVCCALAYLIIIDFMVEDTEGYEFIAMDNIETFLGLSICPLLFYYIRTITRDSRWHKWYFWFMLPALTLGITGTALSFIIGWDRLLEIRASYQTPITPDPGHLAEKLYTIFSIKAFNLTEIILSVAMIGLCIFHLFRYSKHTENCYSNPQDSSVGKMSTTLITSSLILLTLSLMTMFSHNMSNGNLATVILIALSIWISILLWLLARNAYSIVMTREQLAIIDTFVNPENNFQDTAKNDLEICISEWQMREDKPFCKDGITLTDMAQELHLSPRTLSAYINDNKGVNFRRWINILRIEESKRLLKDNPDEKITYIALMCGFSDIATFSKTFRLIEGCSPQEYRQKV